MISAPSSVQPLPTALLLLLPLLLLLLLLLLLPPPPLLLLQLCVAPECRVTIVHGSRPRLDEYELVEYQLSVPSRVPFDAQTSNA